MTVRLADGQRRGRRAPHLRAAALLRGAAARPLVHRGARHHRPHLRHLPGRLPDERGQRARERCAASTCPSRSACSAGSSTAASGSRAMRCTSTCSTRPTSSATTGAVELARDAPAGGRAGARAEADRQRRDGARRRPRDPPDQRSRRRLLPGADTSRAADARRAARARAGGGARNGAVDRGLRLPRAQRRVRARRPLAPGRLRDRARPHPLRRGARHLRRPSTTTTSRRSTSSARTRCTRACASGGTYLCGPLARFALGHDHLSPLARDAARDAGLEAPCRDAFRSIVVRSVELVYACDEALRVIDAYEEPDAPFVAVEPVAGRATASAKRRAGSSTTATASTPTARSWTRRSCRRPRRTSAPSRTTCARSSAATPTSTTTSCALLCEQAIRNYDPCISCATHFLTLEVERA